jgi:hypothetical protein
MIDLYLKLLLSGTNGWSVVAVKREGVEKFRTAS